MTWVPPALVERLPPIWQLPSAARLSGNSRPRVRRGGLYVGEDAAGLDRHGIVMDVDVADFVHPAGRQNDFAVVVMGLTGAGEAGISALRHDRRAGLVTDPHDRRHFGGSGRLDNHRHLALPIVAPGLQQRRHVVWIADHAFVADDLPYLLKNRGLDWFRYHLTSVVVGGAAQPVIDRPPDILVRDRLHCDRSRFVRIKFP